MSDGFAYIDIIIFAMVAAFLVLRLRNALGRKTGNERRRTTRVTDPGANSQDNVVRLPDQAKAPVEDDDPAIADVSDVSVKEGLTNIRMADPTFDLAGFLQGARAAFSMIIEAFARGDRPALEPLLAPSVLEGFASAIDHRQDNGFEQKTEIQGIRQADVAEAMMNGPFARVTIRFVSEQVNATFDADGKLIEGDPDTVEDVIDIWTFERDTRNDDPNWELVETRVPD